MYKYIYVRVMQFLRVNFQSINFHQLIDSLLPLILAQLWLSVKLTDFIKYS